MSMCTVCQTELATDATFCSKCGTLVKQPEIRKAKSEGRSCLHGIVFIGLLTVVFIVAMAVYGNSDEGRANSIVHEATRACEGYVRTRILTPATAVFSSGADVAVARMSTGDYIVTGHVDAENTFGALVRNVYICTLTQTGTTWQLQSIDFGS